MMRIPPAAGAVVMGTGVVSIDLSLDHHETLSRILLAIAAAIWIGLGAVLVARVPADRERLRADARLPAALTGVAGTAVLGARLEMLGWSWAGIPLLAIALALWLALVPAVLAGWRTPTVGVSFMLAVATDSLAVLAAAIGAREDAAWLMDAALVPFVLGLGFYVFVLSRFDFRQLLVGRGDHWVAGGALAISTLDAGRLTSLSSAQEAIAIVLWVLAITWLPVLVLTEVVRPRPTYDLARWSTVFPVGMYAACSFAVGAVAHAGAITDFARVWTWVAVALWLVVFAATIASCPIASTSPSQTKPTS